jgi:TPR repeat protein
MGIAGHLVDSDTWAMTDLGQSKLNLQGRDAATEALALFEAAAAQGGQTAMISLFELLIDPKSATYDPTRAAALIETVTQSSDSLGLGQILSRYRAADETVHQEIEKLLEMPKVYLVAAQSGDIASMRAYAMHLREVASGPADLISSTDWLARAAEGGDKTAMAEYGYALAFGIGTPADLGNAVVWLEKAAAAGSEKAAAITELLGLSEDS